MPQKLTPKTANTSHKILQLDSDNISTRNSWFMIIGPNRVKICNQRGRESPTATVILTKKEFERFIQFYETGK